MSTLEFDTAYSATTGERIPGEYIPHAEADSGMDVDGCDILLDGMPDNLASWGQVTGKTQQYGYRGAIMHASETADDDTIREWVRDAGGDVFAIVEVSGHDDDEPVFPDEPDYCTEYGCAHEPAGWAIIFQDAEVTA